MSREHALTHNETNALLGDYIANELPAQIRIRVEQHLNTCQLCQIDYTEIDRIYHLLGTIKVPTEQNTSPSLADAILLRLATTPAHTSDDIDALLAGTNDEFSAVQQSEENIRPLFPTPGVLTTESANHTQNRYEQEKRYPHMNNEKKSYGNERTYRMESHAHRTNKTRMNTLWLTLVAVLVLAIVAGSLFTFRTVLFGNHNNGPIHPGITTPAPKSTPTAKPTPTPTPTQVTSPQVLPTQTDCPPDGTARAAVMPAITLGTDPNIFYTATTNSALILDRYDVTTGQTEQVTSISLDQLSSTHGGWNPTARLSNDGQWIIFHGIVGSQDAIQMIRIDGQELQTLYCGKVDSMLLSPDQKTLAFNLQFGNLEMLDMATGKLQTDYSNSANLGMYYQPFKWYTNTSLYVMRQLIGVGGTGPFLMRYSFGLDLIKDVTIDSDSQTTNFQNMFPQSSVNNNFGACADFDANQDQILTSNCTQTTGMTGPSTIKIQTLDGTAATIYTDPNNAIMYARFVSPTKILFFTSNITLPPGATYTISQNVAIWEINTDGTGLTQLATLPDNSGFSFDQMAYTPSYIVSRDGSQYVIHGSSTSPRPTNTSSLFFGTLQTAPVTKIPITEVTGQYITVVGWSTF